MSQEAELCWTHCDILTPTPPPGAAGPAQTQAPDGPAEHQDGGLGPVGSQADPGGRCTVSGGHGVQGTRPAAGGRGELGGQRGSEENNIPK